MCGFVYVWFDRKHRRYYVGKHWGPEDDGYVCSSTWMNNAYKRRPQDFKRRIVARISQRNELSTEEIRWLNMIRDEELGVRYYNLKKHSGHWHDDPRSRLTIGQKISDSIKNMDPVKKAALYEKVAEKKRGKPTWMKGRTHTEESRKIIKEKRVLQVCTEETKAKMSASQQALSPEAKENHRAAMNRPETKQKLAEANRRRVVSDETRAKMRTSQSRRRACEWVA